MNVQSPHYQQVDRLNDLLPYAEKLDDYAGAAWNNISAAIAHGLSDKSFVTENVHSFSTLSGQVQRFLSVTRYTS